MWKLYEENKQEGAAKAEEKKREAEAACEMESGVLRNDTRNRTGQQSFLQQVCGPLLFVLFSPT